MLGAILTLDDPILNRLAVSSIPGNLVSTLLRLIVILVLCYAVFCRRQAWPCRNAVQAGIPSGITGVLA
jgi:hypothetical protein